MRIALISEHASPLAMLGGVDAGGQNTHVAELAIALAGAGHDVRVYTRRDSPGLAEVVTMPGDVEVVHVPAGPARTLPKDALLPYMAGFGHWVAAHWQAGTWRPDVVHAHFWMSGLAGLTAAQGRDVPVVLTYHALGVVKRRHQGDLDTSPADRIGYERILGRRVDRVVAQCRDEVRELVAAGVPRGRITVVPSGVDLVHFNPHGPAMPRQPDRLRVLTVGRFVARKGFQDVVRAMRLVPDAELVIVGGPPGADVDTDPFAEQLQALADACGVGDRLRLVGAVSRADMPAWYRSSDLVVAAPWYEPFGLTPLEAMACGVPVIGTAVGGLVDTIVDGVCGELVPPRDPHTLGTSIRRLLRDPVKRRSYRAGAIDRVRSAYSWDRTADRLAAVYTAVQQRTSEAVA